MENNIIPILLSISILLPIILWGVFQIVDMYQTQQQWKSIEKVNLYVWPEGSWCYAEDLESYLQFMSDDYQVHEISIIVDAERYVQYLSNNGKL